MKKALLLSIFAGALAITSCQKEDLPSTSESENTLRQKKGSSIVMETSWVEADYNPLYVYSSGNFYSKDTAFQVFQFTNHFVGIGISAAIVGYAPQDSLFIYCVKMNTRYEFMKIPIQDFSSPATASLEIQNWGNYVMGIAIKGNYTSPQGVVTNDTLMILPSTKRIVRAIR